MRFASTFIIFALICIGIPAGFCINIFSLNHFSAGSFIMPSMSLIEFLIVINASKYFLSGFSFSFSHLSKYLLISLIKTNISPKAFGVLKSLSKMSIKDLLNLISASSNSLSFNPFDGFFKFSSTLHRSIYNLFNASSAISIPSKLKSIGLR